MPLEAISGDLAALGLQESSVKRLLEVMEVGDIDGVQSVLGKESPAANEVRYFCRVMIQLSNMDRARSRKERDAFV